jgi:hypothetical protein
MARNLASVLLILTLSIPAWGTLVVIVPSAEGLVVAADSRTSLNGAACDNQYKITELRRPKRTVVAVTGDVAFVEPPDAQHGDVCGYLKSASRMLDIAAVVKDYLERKNVDPAKLRLEDLGEECVGAVRRFRESEPVALEPYVGREIFSVVVAGYDPHSRTGTVLNFAVRINAVTHRVEAGRFTRIAITLQSRRGVWSYGESDYLNRYVFGGVGRKYLSESTLDLMLVDKPVAEARLDEAVAAAGNVIEAASRTTELTPSPSGIGGQVEMVLLGRKDRPEPVTWKAQSATR